MDNETDNQDPAKADPPEGGGDNETDVSLGELSDEQKTSVLNALSKITGQEFKDAKAFNEHYKGLANLVGDQAVSNARAGSVNFEKVVDRYIKENNVDRDIAIKELTSDVALKPKKSGKDDSELGKALAEVQSVLKEARDIVSNTKAEAFKSAHPEIGGNIKIVEQVAKSLGRDLEDVFNDKTLNLQILIKNATAYEESKRKSDMMDSTTHPSAKFGDDWEQAQKNLRKVAKETPGRVADAEAKLVETYLSKMAQQMGEGM